MKPVLLLLLVLLFLQCSLANFTTDSQSPEEDEKDPCLICREPIISPIISLNNNTFVTIDGDMVPFSNRGCPIKAHVFHNACIREWFMVRDPFLKGSAKCPLCMGPLANRDKLAVLHLILSKAILIRESDENGLYTVCPCLFDPLAINYHNEDHGGLEWTCPSDLMQIILTFNLGPSVNHEMAEMAVCNSQNPSSHREFVHAVKRLSWTLLTGFPSRRVDSKDAESATDDVIPWCEVFLLALSSPELSTESLTQYHDNLRLRLSIPERTFEVEQVEYDELLDDSLVAASAVIFSGFFMMLLIALAKSFPDSHLNAILTYPFDHPLDEGRFNLLFGFF